MKKILINSGYKFILFILKIKFMQKKILLFLDKFAIFSKKSPNCEKFCVFSCDNFYFKVFFIVSCIKRVAIR